jgi:hypothetical protein
MNQIPGGVMIEYYAVNLQEGKCKGNALMLTLLAQYCLCLADSQQGTVDVLLLLL